MRRALLVPLLALSVGCDDLWTWVSQEDVDDRLLEIDADGDGVSSSGGDCDDSNSSISPELPESWYDGVDQDCLGDGGVSDYDADGDLYFHTSVNDYLTEEGEPLKGDNELDCDDANAAVNPNAEDTWYDGIDSNCLGDDDYDQDLDGYQAQGEVDGGDDCVDTDATVNPDATDTWYDGVDHDCDGSDDYDKDGDGAPHSSINDDPDTALHVPEEDLDCDDEDASSFPDATEVWYDGTDQDCSGGSDYDQDEDGSMANLPSGGGDDCDDTDPTAYPGNLEIIADATDHDCDGDASTFAATALGVSWERARNPVWAENSSRIYLSVVVDAVDFSGTDKYDTSVAPWWDAADPAAGVQGSLHWFTAADQPDNSYETLDGQALMVDDTYIYGVISLLSGGVHRSIRLTRYDPSTTERKIAQASVNADSEFDSVAMVLDDSGVFHVFGCDATYGLQYLAASRNNLANSTAKADTQIAGNYTACDAALQDGPVPGVPPDTADTGIGGDQHVLISWNDGDLDAQVTSAFDAADSDVTLVEQDTDATRQPSDIDYLVVDDFLTEAVTLWDEGTIEITKGPNTKVYTSPDPAIQADIGQTDDGTLYVAYVDQTGAVQVASGKTTTAFQLLTTLTLDFAAEEVAIWLPAAGNQLMVAAVEAENVAVGVAQLE